MTGKLPPTPWDWVAAAGPSANGNYHAYLVDATGRKIAAIWGTNEERPAIANLIVSLVNGAVRDYRIEGND